MLAILSFFKMVASFKSPFHVSYIPKYLCDNQSAEFISQSHVILLGVFAVILRPLIPIIHYLSSVCLLDKPCRPSFVHSLFSKHHISNTRIIDSIQLEANIWLPNRKPKMNIWYEAEHRILGIRWTLAVLGQWDEHEGVFVPPMECLPLIFPSSQNNNPG